MTEMNVVEIVEAGKIRTVKKPIPIRKKGEALLKIKYCGICGSDVATFTGNQPFASYPRVPGHEFSAEIVEIEENKNGFKKGMIVTANPYFNCGHCYSCERGKVNCCESNETMGVQRDGSFREYITMPIERLYDGKGLSPKLLALIEPFSIGYHAVNRGDIQKGDKVLVIGAGAIGMFAMLSAKQRGAEVYVADVFEGRLKKALEIGADGVINSSKENLQERVKEITDLKGMDVCIEAVGRAETFLECINASAFGSKIVLIGNGKTEVKFNQSILVKKELNIYGSRNSLNDFVPLIDLVSSGKVKIDKLITNEFPLSNVADAFNILLNNDGSTLKVIIDFN